MVDQDGWMLTDAARGVDIATMNTRIVVAALSAAALMVPAVAVAKPDHGKGHQKQTAKAHGKGKKAKKVMFVFKGTLTAPDTVTVVSGNSHVRKGGFVGRPVAFDFADVRVVAADTNADQKVDMADVKVGDVVLVQARVARRTEYAQDAPAIAARKLVDKTNAPVEDDEGTDTAPTS
jgi:hypothetical protein